MAKQINSTDQTEVNSPAEGSNIVPIVDTPARSKEQSNTMNSVLVDFLRNVHSIQLARKVVLPHVFEWLKSQHESHSKKLAKYAARSEDGQDVYRAISAHQASEMFRAIRELDNLGGARIPETLQRSLFTQLFSEYDAFIGSLLKVIYSQKIDLLKSISRQISFADLLNYEDLNSIKLDMLEKEVEAFRRNSYADQFSTLENKFTLTLKAFPEWGEFVELSQRRNLIVHNGSVVSEQYLVVCDREKHKFVERPRVGDPLSLSGAYFSRAIIVVSKVAFMLCHTLRRKLFQDQLESAHNDANTVLFDLLRDKRWSTANAIASFALSNPMRSNISDMDLRIRTINAAIAAKFSENEAECQRILKSMDWTAPLRDFRLAIAVLSDDYAKAAELMLLIGKSGELIEEISYHDWPLFHKFRESPEFLAAYQKVYGVSFISESIRHKTESAEANQAVFNQDMETVDVPPETPIDETKTKVKRVRKKILATKQDQDV
jgi:hypothetical protein